MMANSNTELPEYEPAALSATGDRKKKKGSGDLATKEDEGENALTEEHSAFAFLCRFLQPQRMSSGSGKYYKCRAKLRCMETLARRSLLPKDIHFHGKGKSKSSPWNRS